MQKYEEMFFNNKEELEKLIVELVEKSIDDDADAQKELDAIKEQIDYTYEISAEVDFELDCPVTSGTANCETIEQYKKLKEKTEDGLYAEDLDKWVELYVERHGTAYLSDTEVKVQFIGMGTNASNEASTAFEELLKKEYQEEAKAAAAQRIMQTEVMIARLQEQLIAYREEIENLNNAVQSNCTDAQEPLEVALELHK